MSAYAGVDKHWDSAGGSLDGCESLTIGCGPRGEPGNTDRVRKSRENGCFGNRLKITVCEVLSGFRHDVEKEFYVFATNTGTMARDFSNVCVPKTEVACVDARENFANVLRARSYS